jgi:hypothetical protein
MVVIMTKLLEQAFKRASELPESEQDAFASRWLEELEDEAAWDALVVTPESQAFLDRMAQRVRDDIKAERVRPLDPDAL